MKINHARLCIKIYNIQNIFVNDPKYFCRVELKHDRRASRLTSPGLEIDITLALPLPRLLCHYQLWFRAILYTVLSHQRTSRGELLLSVQCGQTNLDKRGRLEDGYMVVRGCLEDGDDKTPDNASVVDVEAREGED